MKYKPLFKLKCPECVGHGAHPIYSEDGADAIGCETCSGTGRVRFSAWLKAARIYGPFHLPNPEFDPFAED